MARLTPHAPPAHDATPSSDFPPFAAPPYLWKMNIYALFVNNYSFSPVLFTRATLSVYYGKGVIFSHILLYTPYIPIYPIYTIYPHMCIIYIKGAFLYIIGFYDIHKRTLYAPPPPLPLCAPLCILCNVKRFYLCKR